MRWVVGVTIGEEQGEIEVFPTSLENSEWENAAEYAHAMASALYPDQDIEIDYIKEYDDDVDN
tara:strand:- start:180 stop:368 length:189 start_codon:yes stop_codon:yes gene_type:complete